MQIFHVSSKFAKVFNNVSIVSQITYFSVNFL